MADTLKKILLLLALPCLTIAGFQVVDWVYVCEISGRYMVLGGLAIVIALLWLLRDVKYRYVILAVFLCLMTVKSDNYIKNWERGYDMIYQWLESNQPGDTITNIPHSVYYNAHICTTRIQILEWMRNYYWKDLRPRYVE